MKHWFVGITKYGNRGLFIKYENGEQTGFSYVSCITPPSAKKDFLTALRNEIYEQVKEVKDTVGDTFQCPLCNETKSKTVCHIDHDAVPFKYISETWCFKNNIDIEVGVALIHNGPIINLSDKTLAENWKKYHKQEARLRPTCSTCNIKKGTKTDVRLPKYSRCLIVEEDE